MTMIKLATFKGEIPSYAPNLLPNEASAFASDCHFDDGTLNPIEKNLYTGDNVNTNTKSLFRYEDTYWFQWSTDVDVIKSPIARDVYRRVYWTDGTFPKVTYNTTFNGQGALPVNYFQLGVPAPTSAPTIASFTPFLDQESAVSVYYAITYVTAAGEEGAPSPVSAKVECHPIGVEVSVETARSITVSFTDGSIKITDDDGGDTSGFTYDLGVLSWAEKAPSADKALILRARQVSRTGVFSPESSIKLIMKPTTEVGGAGSNPLAPTIDVKTPYDPINYTVDPTDLTDGNIMIEVLLDHAEIGFGGYATIKINNEGVTDNTNSVGQVVLNIQPPGTNRSNIERIKIYRTVSGAGSSEFLAVDNIPISQSSYTDSKSDGDLGETLSTETFAMPPDEMLGLCYMANGICAGFIDNQVLFSEVFLPYAWPEEYRLSVDFDIVAIAPIGTSLVVGTTGDPYLYTGISPANIAGQKLEIAQACVSKRSMINTGPAVIYACPDGLVAIAPDGVRLITENIISPLQWRKLLDPSTIRAYRHETKYIGVHSTGAFIFDPIAGDFRRLNDSWSAGYTDPTDDTLYIVKNGDVLKFRGGAENKELTWKSKEYDAISSAFSCCRIISDDISKVSFSLSVDGVVVFTRAAGLVKQTFTLPAVRGDKWQFEVKSTSRIESIKMATDKQELRN